MGRPDLRAATGSRSRAGAREGESGNTPAPGASTPAARHDDANIREANQPLVRTLYKLAGRAGEDSGARDQIAYIVSQFASFQQLQKPFLQVFEDVAKTAAQYRELEHETSGLRTRPGAWGKHW